MTMPMFPITDLTREDDIRRRRRRAALLLGGMVAVPWLLFGRSHDHTRIAAPGFAGIHFHVPSITIASGRLPRPDADAPRTTIRANTLRVDLPCAESVTVLSDGIHPGEAVVSVRHGEHASLDRLHLADGLISQSAGCAGSSGNFTVRVAASTPLTLVQSGDVDIRAGSFTAPVTIDSSGSGDVKLAASGPLTTRQTASGTVMIGTINGPVTARLQGSGDLDIGDGSIEALDATSDGSGDLHIGHAILGGGAITVTLRGSGNFVADTVTGILDASTMSDGDIKIGSLTTPHARLDGFGSGDIAIERGRIGTLSSDLKGSGNLTIHAKIDGGQITHHGSGNLDLPADSKATLRDNT
jgi:hypothetical protein